MKYHCQFPLHVINLKKRPDRLQSIRKELFGRNEFNVTIVEAIEHPNGAMGLWHTISSIISNVADEELIIICEDDHQFTESYSPEILASCIEEGRMLDADILLGGVSWFNVAAPISGRLFSVDTFSATQFMVIFNKFYKDILNADFGNHDSADYKIAALTTRKFVIHPFISTQKEFGYSDATYKNNNFGRVTSIFNSSIGRLALLNKVWKYYYTKPINQPGDLKKSPSNQHQGIPTYILSSDLGNRHMENIKQQFEDKHEFDPIFVSIENPNTGTRAFLYCVQEIIKISIENNEDKIVLCGSDHQFTSAYTKAYFFECIQLAENAGTKIISGGTNKFGSGMAVHENLFWVDWFTNAQFIVLFKGSFDALLKLPKKSNLSLSMICNYVSSNKLLIYPFISKSLEFGNEDISNEAILDHYKSINFLKAEYMKYSISVPANDKQNNGKKGPHHTGVVV